MVRGKGRFGLRGHTHTQGVQRQGQLAHLDGSPDHIWQVAKPTNQPGNTVEVTHTPWIQRTTLSSLSSNRVTDCLVTHEPAYLVPVVVVSRVAMEFVTDLKKDSGVSFDFQSERKLIAEQFIT